MMESNTQGHGTIKKMRTGAVISTLAISALGVATGVSASETEVAVNEPATQVVAKNEVVPKVPCQHDVDNAKAESDKANQGVTKQKEVVTSTEANIAATEKTITDTTKKVEEVKSVTPEKVAEAKADADKKADELATAEKTVANAEKSVSATAEKVENQTKVVEGAEKTATAAANKVDDAKKKVDALSSTDKNNYELKKNVYVLETQVGVDKNAVKKAQNKLDDGKKAIENKDEAMKTAEAKVAEAEEKVKQTEKDLESANTVKSEKEDALAKAKSALEVAKQGTTQTATYKDPVYRLLKADKETPYEVGYSPALSQGYIDAIKALADGTGTTDAVDTAVFEVPYSDPKSGAKADSLSDFNSTGKRYYKGQYIPYGAEDKDAEEIADFQHLTKEQQINLSVYAATIINELRAKVGTEPLKVTKSSMKLAEAFNNNANGYTTGNGGEYNPLNSKDLSLNDKLNMAKETTNNTGSALAVRTSSIPHFLDLGENLTTMARIKQVVYQGIVNTLMGGESNTGSEDRFSGALSLLGLRDSDKTAFGVGIGAMISHLNKGYEASFTLSVPQLTTETTQKVDAKAVEAAEKEYLNAYKELEDAKSKAISAKMKYSGADYALHSARLQLSDIRMNKIDISALEKALKEAKDQLEQDKKDWQTAKEVLAIAESDTADKVKALAEAKKTLATAKEEKATADKALATAKGELEVLTKAHDVAVLARKSVGEDLARKRKASKEATDTYDTLSHALTNRDEVLKSLDKELTDAKSKLGVLRAELKTAKEELTKAEGIAEVKARILANLEQLKADCDVQAQDKVVVATVGTKGDKTYQAPAQATDTKVENKKQLPNTGTKESGLLAFLGASIGLLALAGKRKYNK